MDKTYCEDNGLLDHYDMATGAHVELYWSFRVLPGSLLSLTQPSWRDI